LDHEKQSVATCGDIQLPGSAPACLSKGQRQAGRFANVCTFKYLSGKKTNQRIGTATEYTCHHYAK
jgi:hypothetical protein